MSAHVHDLDEVVRIELGYDRFEAITVVEACRAEGYGVELVQMDRNGVAPGLVAMEPHRMLVRRRDVDAVEGIVRRSFPLTEHDVDPFTRERQRRPRRVVWLVTAVLLAMFLLGFLSSILRAF